jgi:catechol 2,3-dioxygenase-like lactoylglutathione lyase family enzyme
VPVPVVRIARPTIDLERLVPFYCAGLGYEVIASFENHAGFDGIMFGLPGSPYHFEFTHERGAVVPLRPHSEDLVVLYLPDDAEWEAATQRMECAGFAPVRSHNPYWDADGKTYEDPDGRRIVLQHAPWPP